ncbi:hypothetical protein HDU86_003560 [Geranomyces michiganensis]|nr:hypothetical protein HDU86_003560 [Geranomyces michiganensis]
MPQSAHDALYSMYAASLSARLKVLENEIDPAVRSEQPFIIRLDGCAFSTFTKGIVKPFDSRLTDAMVETTKDLVQRFVPVMGYTCSDEISLVFPAAVEPSPPEGPSESADGNVSATPATEKAEEPAEAPEENPRPKKRAKSAKRLNSATHMFSGRVQKLSSITASYAAARFNFHLAKHEWADLAGHVRERMFSHTAHFDGRIVPTPDATSAMECIFWRSNFDGFRNSVSQISNSHFTPKEMHGKGLKEQLKMLAGKGVDPFESFLPRYLYGTWVKKEQFEMHGMVNPKTGEPIAGPVIRNRVRTGSFNWADWTPEQRTAFAMAKLWPADGPPKHEL